jgi:hypothetical protein
MILVDIYAVAVDQTYDFMLDENADLSAVMLEITEMIAKKTGSGSPANARDFMLYLTERETPLPLNKTLFESGVRDGDRLILV